MRAPDWSREVQREGRVYDSVQCACLSFMCATIWNYEFHILARGVLTIVSSRARLIFFCFFLLFWGWLVVFMVVAGYSGLVYAVCVREGGARAQTGLPSLCVCVCVCGVEVIVTFYPTPQQHSRGRWCSWGEVWE